MNNIVGMRVTEIVSDVRNLVRGELTIQHSTAKTYKTEPVLD